MRSHLSHTPHIFTNMCLPHGKPYAIKSHFILDSSFLCCAWLCCHTHAHSSCSCFSSILPPPCGCIMSSISIMPALDCIGRFCHIPFISPSHLQPSRAFSLRMLLQISGLPLCFSFSLSILICLYSY